MTDITVDRTPRPRAVVVEQLCAVGLAVRREVLWVGVLVALTLAAWTILIRLGVVFSDGSVVHAQPLDPGEGFAPLAAIFAVLFALAVWKGERPFDDTPLWSLPGDHRLHALTKLAAGWVWLMAVVGAAALCLVIMTLASGGTFGVEEARLLVTDPAGALAGTPGATETVVWMTPWWEWVLPFTAATVGYLLANALVLGTPHPLRWGLGLWLAILAMGGLSHDWNIGWLAGGFDLMIRTLGAWDDLRSSVLLPSGPAVAWRTLPTVGMWATSTALWIGVGVAGVLGALVRSRDH